ncbi:MAG: glycine--tRNA ligase [Candidatus Pacearchaeota archaeon]
MEKITIDEITNFCKRKGFVYPSAEIYGSLAGFWDFGHLGVELKNNIKREWWNFHVIQREDIVGIDGSIITNPKVWEASGHVSNFVDLAVICKKCGYKTKLDKSEVGKKNCPRCNGHFDVKGEFNPMFTTNVGPIKEDSVVAFLRPETAQLIFANFKFVYDNARLKLPFGIAQIGKAFRNEIAPRDFLFRCREFEQMEIEYFVNPNEPFPYSLGESEIFVYSAELQEKNEPPVKMKIREAFKIGIIKTEWHAYWLEQEFLWFVGLGANKNNFRIRQHLSDEKSHYALDTWDLEYNFPFGWHELQGMANRTDFDLKQHEIFSKSDLKLIDQNGDKFIPHVICEPSQGVERAFLVFMFDAYRFDEVRNNVVLSLHPKLAPVKAAVLPIVKKEEYEEIARRIFTNLKRENLNVVYDRSGSIGRRYARNDEIGTPVCITIDEDSKNSGRVTLRDRDTTDQFLVKIEDVVDAVKKLCNGIKLNNIGEKINTRKK